MTAAGPAPAAPSEAPADAPFTAPPEAPRGAPAVSPSDPPRRPAGTRARSGNAMHRARAAVLDAAAHCVERYGVRRTTMGDIALKAAVAKGTLYNHFRTKDDVLVALVTTRVDALVDECTRLAAEQGLAAAAAHAAETVGGSAPLRRVAAEDAALAARLLAPGDGRGWEAARDGVRRVLRAAGAADDDAGVELVLRWLVSHVHWPAGADPQGAERLAAALTAAAVAPPAAPPPAQVTSPG